MEKNVEVVDEAGNVYEPTWPKRAKGLVKQGRARFVNENRICLACPPDIETEETHMSNVKNVFGNITVADILQQIRYITEQTEHITAAYGALTTMGDGDSGDCGAPGNVMGAAKANAVSSIMQSRETTNQHILRLYEKMYDDLIRLNEADRMPKTEMPME